MASLRLLPGEKEELRLRPAWGSLWPQRLVALAFLAPAALLALAFHSPWWTGHRPSDWTAAWTWLWGTDGAAYLWTVGLMAAVGALAGLRSRMRRRLATGALLGILACLVAALSPVQPTVALPLAVAAMGVGALLWVEAQRLGTTYHITNLRLVERRLLPRALERSVHYDDLVDVDAAPSSLRDTGTLIPVLAPRRPDDGRDGSVPAWETPRFPGVRPFARVRRLVELLARRATASERVKAETRVDDDVAEALAGLHRRA